MNNNQSLIDGLRDLATFLETHPELPEIHYAHAGASLSGPRFLKAVRQFGAATKELCKDFYSLRKTFGPVVCEIFTLRENICERVVVGKQTIPAQPEREVERASRDERLRFIPDWILRRLAYLFLHGANEAH